MWPEDGCQWLTTEWRPPGGLTELDTAYLNTVAWRADASGTALILLERICRRQPAQWWSVGCEYRHVDALLVCEEHRQAFATLNQCTPCGGKRVRIMVRPGIPPEPPPHSERPGRLPYADTPPEMEDWTDPVMHP
jgi:hypothetical protein